MSPTQATSPADLTTTSEPADPAPVATSGPTTPSDLPVAKGRVRNRYIDTLRSLALARVVLFHLFGWIWLPLLFPSMGVMFAFAGSLMAASLDRSSTGVGTVVRRRLRRLLPPLWAMGLILVPIMVVAGWTATTSDASPLGPTVLAWILPIVKPPASDLGADWAVPLWYIRSYLWLMVLSPALLWLWRHWPRSTMTIPFVVLLLQAGHILTLEGEIGEGIVSVATFAACWMLGFYHHDGRLRRWSLPRVVVVGVLLAVAGLAWSVAFPEPGQGPFNVSDIPVATALYDLGFTLILLRLPITLRWVGRVPVLSHLITLTNRRAMTIYLWGNTAIFVAVTGLKRFGIIHGDVLTWQSGLIQLGATAVVLFLAVLCLGWVEDLAARRRPRILPLAAEAGPRSGR